MILSIDTTRSKYMLASSPESLVDRQSGQPRHDSGGKALMQCDIVEMGPNGAQILRVKFPAGPANLEPNTMVTLMELTAAPWSIDGKSGVSFTARAITPAGKGS